MIVVKKMSPNAILYQLLHEFVILISLEYNWIELDQCLKACIFITIGLKPGYNHTLLWKESPGTWENFCSSNIYR